MFKEYNPGGLLDAVKAKHQLRSDAALAKFFGMSPPSISKMRSGGLPVGATVVLKCLELADMALPEIRSFIGGKS